MLISPGFYKIIQIPAISLYLGAINSFIMTKKWLLAIPVILGVGYLAGPSPASPVYRKDMPQVPAGAAALESYIQSGEALHKLKPDNEARIVWANDTLKNKTGYAIVYLHGFSASQAEGDPVHKNIAAAFGCNLYLSRLAAHGIDTTEPMMNLTAEENWESAKQALAIGKQIGNKVILMGTSTGGTNALQLAAAYPNDVEALVLLSPNIAINNDKAWVLNKHWGTKMAQLVSGNDHKISGDTSALYRQYWYWRYPFNGAAALQEIIETSMLPETFAKVKRPVLMLYYYKDSTHQDDVVKVDAMLKMYDELGTPAALKHKEAMPNTGDHVLGSYIKSHDVEGVQQAITLYMKEVLRMEALKK
jgi:pimeloyl-ACP methyl ester carboxylesterase